MAKVQNELAIARKAKSLRQRNAALESVVAELKRENDKMRAALEHYADATSWPDFSGEDECGEDPTRDVYGLDCDGWTVAADSLGYRFLDDGTEVACK